MVCKLWDNRSELQLVAEEGEVSSHWWNSKKIEFFSQNKEYLLAGQYMWDKAGGGGLLSEIRAHVRSTK
jgi:hypothetical protein